MTTMFDKDGMCSSYQWGITFIRVAGIKGNTKHKTVWLNGMLVHGTFIPYFIGSAVVNLTKVTVIRDVELNSEIET